MRNPFPPLVMNLCPWALRRDAFPDVLAAARLAYRGEFGVTLTDLQRRQPKTRRFAAAPGTVSSGGVVAVVPLTGVLTPRGSFLSFLFGGGGGGVQDFRRQMAAAAGDPDVSAIVVDIDSPGGQSALIPEAAATVRDAAAQKPVIAIANTQAASGAYWIGSQATEFVASPSSYVGSVGVYMHHEDWSAAEARDGISHTFVVAEGSPHKVEGNMFAPLSREAEADWQAEVDQIMEAFVADVASGRGVSTDTVLSDFGGGRVMLADAALEAGMVDRVATMEQVIGERLSVSTAPAEDAMLSAARRSAVLAASVEDEDESEEQPVEAPDSPAPEEEPESEGSEQDEPSESDDPAPDPDPAEDPEDEDAAEPESADDLDALLDLA